MFWWLGYGWWDFCCWILSGVIVLDFGGFCGWRCGCDWYLWCFLEVFCIFYSRLIWLIFYWWSFFFFDFCVDSIEIYGYLGGSCFCFLLCLWWWICEGGVVFCLLFFFCWWRWGLGVSYFLGCFNSWVWFVYCVFLLRLWLFVVFLIILIVFLE